MPAQKAHSHLMLALQKRVIVLARPSPPLQHLNSDRRGDGMNLLMLFPNSCTLNFLSYPNPTPNQFHFVKLFYNYCIFLLILLSHWLFFPLNQEERVLRHEIPNLKSNIPSPLVLKFDISK